MALQVWLPLNGDLHNQGLTNITFSNTNTSNIVIDSNGKIGKCYKRIIKNSAGYITSNNKILLDGDLSMCCWANVIETPGDSANGLITNHSHNNNTGFGITVKQISTSDYRISCNTGTGSNRTYNTYYGTSNIKGAWHHLALTYDNTKHEFKLWVDGICEKTQSYTNGPRNDLIKIFDWSTTYDTTSYRPACALNDVRIYDHCLSAKEVKEIAQGLILHYPLNNNGLGGENLFSWANNVTGITLNNYSNTGSFTQFTNSLQFDPSLTVGEKYTISFWAKSPNGTTSLQLYNANSYPKYFYFSTTLTNNLNTEWQFFKYTVTNTQYNGSNTPNTNPSIWKRIEIYANKIGVIVKQIKVEKGEIATQWSPAKADTIYPNVLNTTIFDQSGYGRNGTINGTLAITSLSPSFNCATYLNGTDTRIDTNNNFSFLNASPFTVSIWVYNNDWTTATASGSKYIISHYTSSKGGFRIYSNSEVNRYRFQWIDTDNTGQDIYFSAADALTSGWYLFVATYDGTIMTTYLNGNKYTTKTTTYKDAENTNTVRLGANDTTAVLLGSYSDFRIYATALSEADVKALYRNSMIVSGATKTPRDLE